LDQIEIEKQIASIEADEMAAAAAVAAAAAAAASASAAASAAAAAAAACTPPTSRQEVSSRGRGGKLGGLSGELVALREQAAALRARAAAEPIPQSPDAPTTARTLSPDAPTTARTQSPDAPTTALPQSPDEPLCWAPVPGSPGLERRIGLESQLPGTLTPSRAGGSGGAGAGAGGGGGGGGRDGDDEGDGSPRVRLVVRSSPLRASHLSREHDDWTLPNMEDEELPYMEDATHRQQTAAPNTTLEGVSGVPVAGATGAAPNTARVAPALRTAPIAGVEAERDWL